MKNNKSEILPARLFSCLPATPICTGIRDGSYSACDKGSKENDPSFHSVYDDILVATEQSAAEHRMFASRAFSRIRGTVTTVQRTFRVNFNTGRRGAVPGCDTILR